MSSAATFIIIANEGRTDRLLLATSLLNQRIKDIQCARAEAGKQDCWPTLVDIEKTHLLFTNAHFKPYVAMAYEYRKVPSQNGTPAFGTSVIFSIPQIGDFFHDMAFRVTIAGVQASFQNVPAQSTQLGVTLPTTGYLTTPWPLNVINTAAGQTSTYYRLVDYQGNELAIGGNLTTDSTTAGYNAPPAYPNRAASVYTNLIRYCEFPGNRIFDKVKFDVNDNHLDEYESISSVMEEKWNVPVNKRVGYNKLVGQEVPVDCWGGVRSSQVNRVTPSGTTTASDVSGPSFANGSIAPGLTPNFDPTVTSRYLRQVVNGPQTPKLYQPQLELIHKLKFWFNQDVRLSIPSVSIPYGQRFITADITAQDNILFEESNCFVEKTVTNSAEGSTDGNITVTYVPYFNRSPGLNFDGSGSPIQIDLYINNIFVNPEVHDIYIRRIGFSLIRVHLTQKTPVTASNQQQLNQLKWPIEYIQCGIRPDWNVNPNNRYQWRDWHRYTKVNSGSFVSQSDALSVVGNTAPHVWNVTSSGLGLSGLGHSIIHSVRKSPIIADEFVVEEPVTLTLSLVSHGVTLYDAYNVSFYNRYIPVTYGAYNINTPADSGVFMLNFCFYPGTYQPSGHLNLSRARETYLGWTVGPYVSVTNSATLHVVASAINFLLVSDGSAVLRFST